MKSLPSFTFALIALAITGYGISGAALLGFQADPPKGGKSETGKGPIAPSPNSANSNELPTDAPGAESLEAKAVLDQVRQRLRSYGTIKAKLIETVAMGNRRFTVSGGYLQGANFKLRLDYQMKIGGTEGSVLEVCDGQVLWTRHQIGTETRVTRRDVRQILQAAAEGGFPDNFVNVELGFGGLPGLFASIEKSIQFDQLKEDTQDGRKVLIIEGGWRAEMLTLWKANNPKAPLPDYVPTRIRLFLDGNSFCPRRILYLGRNTEGSLRPMVSLDFSEIETNIAIPADKFKYSPPDGVFPEDQTQQFLEQIRNRRQPKKSGE